jgi:nondiscriminating aspartyl-tRNA synthetase
MNRTLIVDTITKIGETVLIKGWVDSKRDHGKIAFIDLRDRTGKIQVFAFGNQVEGIGVEDVVYITGKVQARPEKLINPKLATGTVEVVAEKIDVIATAAELPFDMSKDDLEPELPIQLDYRGLTLRHPKVQAIFRVQQVVVDAFRRSLQAKDFLEFQAPSIISSVPEGGAEVFKVKYFDYETYLSQSPQLYKSLLVGAFERVFSVNKIFRAEPSVTTRHLTEATSLDVEFGFIDSYQDIMDMEEYVVKFILNEVGEKCATELALFEATLPKVSEKIPMLKLREAQQIIFERTGRDCRQEKDLAPEDEREICKWSLETHQSDLVFISHFLSAKKPFYVYPDPADPTYAFSVDLLGRGVEWSSGGQRLNDYNQILDHVKKWGLKEADIELYLQAFRFGMPPLGGFALGAERVTMHILGIKNIREAVMFPRDMERVDLRLSTTQARGNHKNSESAFDQIISLLKQKEVNYQLFEHGETISSAESAQIRGTTLHQGAKALVLTTGKMNLLYVIPADLKVDLKLLAQKLKLEHLRMEEKDLVQQKTKLQPGSIPPFGSTIGLSTYVDKRLSDSQEIAFNAGRLDKSIKMKYQDFIDLEKPKIIELVD